MNTSKSRIPVVVFNEDRFNEFRKTALVGRRNNVLAEVSNVAVILRKPRPFLACITDKQPMWRLFTVEPPIDGVLRRQVFEQMVGVLLDGRVISADDYTNGPRGHGPAWRSV